MNNRFFFIPCKILILLLSVLTLQLGPANAQKQEPSEQNFVQQLLAKTQTLITPRYDYLSAQQIHQPVIETAQIVPLGGFQAATLAMQSHLSLLRLSAGMRGGSNLNQELRWQASLFDADLYRAPFALGATVMDYNRAGRFKQQTRWLAFRVGPALRLGWSWGAVEPRLVGSAGVSSLTPGAAYSNLGAAANRKLTGVDLGYRAELPLRLGTRFVASGSAGQRILMDKQNLKIHEVRLEGQVMVSTALQLFVQHRWERVTFLNRMQTNRHLRAGFRVLL